MDKKIKGSLEQNKLFLNFYHILNSTFKNTIFTDEDAMNLNIKGVNSVYDLYEFFYDNEIVSNFYICKINQDSRSSKNDKEFYDVLIRFTSLGILDKQLEDHVSLALVGDFELKDGVVNVKRFFTTTMNPKKQHFETSAENIIIEAATSFRTEQTFVETILNSHNLSIIKTLNSTFKSEKERWEKYLEFQTDINNFKKECSLLYLDCKIDNYIKVPKQHEKFQSYHDSDFVVRNFYYVKKNLVSNLKSDQFDEVTIIRLQIYGEEEKYKKIFKDDSLTLFPLSLNRSYEKGDILSLFSKFNYNDKLANELDSNYFLSNSIKVKNHYQKKPKEELLNIISQHESKIKDTNHKNIIFPKEIRSIVENYSFFEVAYEIEFDNSNENVEILRRDIPMYGYLAINPKGDITLINRGKWVLDKIMKNEVANPYLVNHIFNIENLWINETKNNEKIHYLIEELNESQQHCINKALSSSDIFLIQGPPGTGKTQVITEIIHQLTGRSKKVLLSSQNHTAIDNVIERLIDFPFISIIRLLSDNRFRNKPNPFNPTMIVFNFYKNIYTFIDEVYLSNWENQIYDLEEKRKDINDILNSIKILNDDNSYLHAQTEKFKVLEEEIKKTNNDIAYYQNEITQLKNSIKDLESLKTFIINNKNENFNENQFIDLLIKHFNEVAKLLLGNAIKSEYSLTSVYKEIRNQLDIHLQSKKYRELQTELQLDPQNENLKKQLLEIETNAKFDYKFNEFKKAQGNFIADVNKQINSLQTKLKSRYDNSPSTKNIKTLMQNREYMKEKLKTLEDKNIKLKDDFICKLNDFNLNYDTKFKQTELDNITKKLSQDLISINKELKEIEKNKKQYHGYYSEIINFLDKTYQINSYLETPKKTKDFKFNYFLEQETKQYGSTMIKRHTNVVAQTATSNQKYSQDRHKYLRDYEMDGIDLRSFGFDVVIIDEVSKLTPMEILMPLVFGKQVILVGDYRQLPPIMRFRPNDIDEINKKYQKDYVYSDFEDLLSNSLFKKLITKANDSLRMILTKQYRSHEDIMRVVNVFYENQLSLGFEDQNESKQHYYNVVNKNGKTLIEPNKHIYWIDSSRDENNNIAYEQGEERSTSLFNPLEVKITVALLKELDNSLTESDTDSDKSDIVVISFYGLHVVKLKKAIQSVKFKNINVRVSTVDDFQGKEAETIIVNMVRSPRNILSANKEFVKKYERINVALSRAQDLLIIVGAIDFFKNIDVSLPLIDNPSKEKNVKVYKEILDIIREFGLELKAREIIKGKE